MQFLFILAFGLTLSAADAGCYTLANERRLLASSVEGPTWSPDGSELAYVVIDGESTSIGIMNVETGEARSFSAGFVRDSEPTWAPDGSRLGFIRRVGARSRLHVGLRDGMEIQEVPGGPISSWDLNPDWSPTGSQVAMSSTRLGDSGIIVVDVDTGESRRWSDDSDGLSGPRWSTDGARIAASRSDATVGKLYVLSGPHDLRLDAQNDGGFEGIRWIDSRELLYVYLRRSLRRPAVLDLDSGDICEAGPEWDGSRSHIDVSPDRSRVAFVGSRGDEFRGLWIADFSPVPSVVVGSSWGSLKRDHQPQAQLWTAP